jgi:YVTN family beta-propeller protein
MRQRKPQARILATVLFTDIVGSTQLAEELGDRRWRELVARHHRLVRQQLKRFGGREVDTAGDGFFATFDQPAAAIRCACAASDAVRDLGIEIRAGVHVGECEVMGRKLGGIAVHVGARVMAAAESGQVVVTGTTKELVSGSEIDFVDQGVHGLKGVQGEWRLFTVTAVDGTRRVPPSDAKVAAEQRATIQPTARLLRRSRLVAAGIGLLAAGAVAALLISRGFGDTDYLSHVPVNSVGRIDPASNRIAEAIPVGAKPTGVAAREGALWVLRLDSGILVRIDLSSGEQQTESTRGSPTGIAFDDEGTVWVLNALDHTVVSIDPDELVVRTQIDDLPTGTRDIAFGEGALWVTNTIRGKVHRIDPSTGTWEDVDLDDGARPTGVAVGGGVVWITNGRDLLRIDPSTNEAGTWTTLRFPADEVAFGGGAVWVTHQADDAVSRIDPDTRQARGVDTGNGPIGIDIGDGVWVTNSLDGTVWRIDPATGRPSGTIRVGGSPEGIAVGQGGVWVAVHPR